MDISAIAKGIGRLLQSNSAVPIRTCRASYPTPWQAIRHGIRSPPEPSRREFEVARKLPFAGVPDTSGLTIATIFSLSPPRRPGLDILKISAKLCDRDLNSTPIFAANAFLREWDIRFWTPRFRAAKSWMEVEIAPT